MGFQKLLGGVYGGGGGGEVAGYVWGRGSCELFCDQLPKF